MKTNKEIAIQLLESTLVISNLEEGLNEIGLETDHLDLLGGLTDTFLDLLGVPEDETIEDNDGFCRDWFYGEVWDFELEVFDGTVVETVEQFVDRLISELDKINKEI